VIAQAELIKNKIFPIIISISPSSNTAHRQEPKKLEYKIIFAGDF